LVHGDVRPATLVFGEDRRPRLVDAGLNYLIAEAAGGITARSNHLAKYASPEQAAGGAVQPKSDVYALCLTVLEAVTGAVPFVGDSTVATLANRADRLMPVSADLGSLASVLERAGRPDPRDRSSAAEFGRALVQSAERLPRPAPLPLLVGSLFGPDTTPPDAPVDPTGPLRRPLAPPTDAAVQSGSDGVAVGVVGAAPIVLSVLDHPAEAPAPATAHIEVPPTEPQPVLATTTAVHRAVASPEVVPPPAPIDARDALDDEPLDPADEFPDQPPAPVHRRWFILLLLLLAIGGGALAWYNTQPEEVVVPDVVGMQSAAAVNQLGDFETLIVEEADEEAPVGQVIAMDPVAGSRVDEGTTVTLTVSSGPAPRVLPELTGLTVDEATAKLDGLGLLVEQADPVFDEAVPQGVVVSWTVPDSPSLTAGGTVLRGTTVRLVVSGGPAPRIVPDLSGATLDAATAAVNALGLEIAQAPDEFSNTVPVGQIVRQDPAAGSELARGATVTVVLSRGPDLVSMPPLAGLDYNGIRAALEGAGWTVGTVTGDPNTGRLNNVRVNGQEVSVGFTALRGTPVDLVFITDPPPA